MYPNSGGYFGSVGNASIQPVGQKTRSNKRLVLIVVALVLLLVTVVVGVLSATSGSESKIAKEFITDIQNGDASASYQLLSDRAKQGDTQDQWNAKVAKIKDFYTKIEHKSTTVVTKKSDTEDGVSIETYQASGKDGEYIMSITIISPVKGKSSVLSFSSVPGTYTKPQEEQKK